MKVRMPGPASASQAWRLPAGRGHGAAPPTPTGTVCMRRDAAMTAGGTLVAGLLAARRLRLYRDARTGRAIPGHDMIVDVSKIV